MSRGFGLPTTLYADSCSYLSLTISQRTSGVFVFVSRLLLSLLRPPSHPSFSTNDSSSSSTPSCLSAASEAGLEHRYTSYLISSFQLQHPSHRELA